MNPFIVHDQVIYNDYRVRKKYFMLLDLYLVCWGRGTLHRGIVCTGLGKCCWGEAVGLMVVSYCEYILK